VPDHPLRGGAILRSQIPVAGDCGVLREEPSPRSIFFPEAQIPVHLLGGTAVALSGATAATRLQRPQGPVGEETDPC